MNRRTEELVSAASQGDGAAVEQLLVRYLPDLQTYFARHAGDLVRARESTADLAQSICREVLERLTDGRFEYRGEAAFREWMYRAAVMKMLERHRHWRRDKRDPARELARGPGAESGEGGSELAGVEATPSQHAIHLEELERFHDAFAQLDERYQAVIRMHQVEGRTHAEVASVLGIEEANSRMLLTRALAKLAKLAAS